MAQKIKHIIYSNEQLQQVTNFLNNIQVTGMQQAKFLVAVSNTLDQPLDIIFEDANEINEDFENPSEQ